MFRLNDAVMLHLFCLSCTLACQEILAWEFACDRSLYLNFIRNYRSVLTRICYCIMKYAVVCMYVVCVNMSSAVRMIGF